MKHDVRVYTRQIQGHRALHYAYNAAPGMGFLFHLLSEVGEPWKEAAKRRAHMLALKRGCVIKTVELDAKPWYVDVLVKESTSDNA